jgi:hypothetical protein
MNPILRAILFAGVLFVGMLVVLELGRRLGHRRQAREGDAGHAGFGAVEGAVFALMGLLIAFTFSGAAERFEQRRQQILDEANALGTVWQQLDLLPASAQPELRDLLRRYVDARLALYDRLPDLAGAKAEVARANELQSAIWTRAAAAAQAPGAATPLTAMVLTSLGQAFDLAAARVAALQIHPPRILFIMLGVFTLMSALLAGVSMGGARSRSWVHMFGFALIMAVTVYIILDLEFPRVGFIRLNDADQFIRDVRQSMQ